MKFKCDECGTRYAIADAKVAGKTVRIRCKKCQSAIVVKGPRPAAAPPDEDDAEEQPTRMVPASELEREHRAAVAAADASERRSAAPPPPPPEDGAEWHAVIGGKQGGPFTQAELADEVAAGRLTGRTYVWRDGMDGWGPAAQVPELAGILSGGGAAPRPARGREAAASEPLDSPAPRKTETPARTGPGEEASPAGDRVVRPLSDAPSEASTGLDDLFGAGRSDAAPEPQTAPAARKSSRKKKVAPADPEPDAAGAGQGAPHDDDPFAAVEGDEDPFAAALASAAASDPFAAVISDSSDVDEAPRETTQMFILASGVNKQKSPWRIAAAILGFVAVLGSLGFLAALAGVDMGGLIPTSSGRRQTASGEWVSGGSGDTSLRDRLLGIRRDEPAPTKTRTGGGQRTVAAPEALSDDGEPLPEKEAAIKAELSHPEKAAIADLYAESDRRSFAIKARQPEDGPEVDRAQSPIDPAVIQKKMAESQRAFQTCVQQELRRNPAFKGGKIVLVLTVTPSGIVRSAAIRDRNIDQSEVGACIKRTSRRIMLPSFAGDDPVDFELPLVLSKGY